MHERGCLNGDQVCLNGVSVKQPDYMVLLLNRRVQKTFSAFNKEFYRFYAFAKNCG